MRSRVFIMLALTAVAVPATAIVIRHDVSDEAYLVPESDFPTLARVMATSEGVLIAPQWVITAAHVVEGVDPFSRWRVTLGGREYAVSKIILHPRREPGTVNSDFDLALLKLEAPVTAITPTPLYRWNDEALQIATIVGRGGTRTGLAGSGDFHRDDRMRRATNRIQAAFSHSLVTVFDAPPSGTELEGAGGPRDSGGPAFLTRDGIQYLAGVGSFASPPNDEPGIYGTLDGFGRMSTHREWIEGVIAGDPPSTLPKWSEEHRLGGREGWPDTPAGRLARALFQAYGDDAGRLTAFMRAHGSASSPSTPEARAAGWVERFNNWGPLVPYGYRTLGDRDIAFIAYATRSEEWVGMWITADPADPARITSLIIGGLPRPEGAPERL